MTVGRSAHVALEVVLQPTSESFAQTAHVGLETVLQPTAESNAQAAHLSLEIITSLDVPVATSTAYWGVVWK